MKSKSLFLFFFFWVASNAVNAQFLIKFSPTQVLLSNEVGLAYEHRIWSKISAEVQLGTTYSKDFTKIESILENRFERKENLENNWGAYGALSIRYYLLGYNVAPAGFYVGTLYKYRIYNAFAVDELTNLKANAKNSQFVLQAICGYQLPFTKVFSMDFYVGLGVNFQREELPKMKHDQFMSFWTLKPESRVTFAPSIGVKLGFGQSGRELL